MSGMLKYRAITLIKAKLMLALFPVILFLVNCSTLEEGMPAGDEDWSFIVLGDVRQGYGVYSRLAEMIGDLLPVPCAAFISGDIMLEPGNEVEWLNFHRYSMPITSKMPLFIARGNHEGNDPGSEQSLRENMGLDGDRFYYTFLCNQALFIVLDTEIRGEEGSISGAQFEWLVQQLNAADDAPEVQYVFIILHRPLFPRGFHQGGGLENAGELHALFLPHGKLKAVFCGHDHLFNKYILDGIPYITSGGGGSPLHHGFGGDYFHFVKVGFYEESGRINLKTIGLFKEVVEDFDL